MSSKVVGLQATQSLNSAQLPRFNQYQSAPVQGPTSWRTAEASRKHHVPLMTRTASYACDATHMYT